MGLFSFIHASFSLLAANEDNHTHIIEGFIVGHSGSDFLESA